MGAASSDLQQQQRCRRTAQQGVDTTLGDARAGAAEPGAHGPEAEPARSLEVTGRLVGSVFSGQRASL